MAHVLEHGQRLSASILWELQRRYFDRAGPGAWASGDVPHHATSNPAIAHAYAQVVLGFLRDTALDPAAPLYIVELGAGAGRFAFHFMRALAQLTAAARIPPVAWRYVLTDFTESNLAHWRRHPALAPWLACGRLELARFDATVDDQIVLSDGRTVRAPGNPLIVIANYVFDGIPQDLFDVRAGQLAECLVTASVPAPPADPHDPALLGEVAVAFDRRPAGAAPYGEPELDAILDEYRARLTGIVALPSAALRCLARLAALADQRLLLLSADKGYHDEAELMGRPEPRFAWHGSFSLAVNYHAIARFFERRGGRALTQVTPPGALDVAAFVLDGGAAHPETALAFATALAGAGPEDLHTVRRALEAVSEPSLDTLLALIRLTRHDTTVFLRWLPELKRQAGGAPEPLQRELRGVAQRVWEEHYAIGSEPDLGFELGVLLAEAGDWGGAAAHYERSLATHGPDASCLFNLGLCLFHLGEPARALARFDAALALAPALEAAQVMRRKALAAAR